MQNMAVHIRQSPINAVVANCQLLMIDAELMQDGGMNVVDTSDVISILRFETPFRLSTYRFKILSIITHVSRKPIYLSKSGLNTWKDFRMHQRRMQKTLG